MHSQKNLQVAFGKVIYKLRLEARLSQEELAECCNLHRTYISQLERGLKSPSLSTIEKLSRALEKPPSILIKMAEEAEI